MDRHDDEGPDRAEPTDRHDRADPTEEHDRAADSSAGGEAGAWTVRRSSPNLRPMLVLAVGIVLVVFAAVNFRPVLVNFVVFEARARVVTVIVVAALLGFVVGWFVGRPPRADRRHLREWRAAARRHTER
jgi:uncharacterized integral membrane protein